MGDQTYIWSLITRKFSGEATEKELQELDELLKGQPEWQYSYEMLSDWWSQQDPSPAGKNAVASLERVKKQLKTPMEPEAEEPLAYHSSRTNLLKKWTIAATILIVVGSAAFYFYPKGPDRFSDSPVSVNRGRLSEIATRYGSKSKVTLPDGTLVWLNSGSNLTYNNHHFGEKKREVTLVGEAYFDVIHDAGHPFIIHAGKINVKVLGTAFDVKSYPEDKTIEATLIRGSIEVSFASQPAKKVRLKPHQKLTVYNDNVMITKNILNKTKPDIQRGYKISPMTIIPTDSTVVETSWVENKLAFRSEKFIDLAQQMERWYNVKINFTDSRVKQYQFTGIFVNESLDQALKALQITAPFHYRIEKDEVYISRAN